MDGAPEVEVGDFEARPSSEDDAEQAENLVPEELLVEPERLSDTQQWVEVVQRESDLIDVSSGPEDASDAEIDPQERRKSSTVRIKIEPNSQKLSVCSEEGARMEELDEIPLTQESPTQSENKIPKYQIAEFTEAATNLKFEIKHTKTAFRILLPTLKKVVEIPEWEKVALKRESANIAKAMRVAQARTRLFLMERAKYDYRMATSEVQHLNNQEVAQTLKARMRLQGRNQAKELTEPPQKCQPWVSLSHTRPTQLPPMPNLRPSNSSSGERLRCARQRYNERSDDTFLRFERCKLLRAAERQMNCSRLHNQRLATPPQRHDPWAPPQRPRKLRPDIPLPTRRH